ncbi:hypothetical protein A2U01_0095071, partial [Trifolium medium]|nr:hypothetical protein [Trifolium medium]
FATYDQARFATYDQDEDVIAYIPDEYEVNRLSSKN